MLNVTRADLLIFPEYNFFLKDNYLLFNLTVITAKDLAYLFMFGIGP